jgi:hypothetical protein
MEHIDGLLQRLVDVCNQDPPLTLIYVFGDDTEHISSRRTVIAQKGITSDPWYVLSVLVNTELGYLESVLAILRGGHPDRSRLRIGDDLEYQDRVESARALIERISDDMTILMVPWFIGFEYIEADSGKYIRSSDRGGLTFSPDIYPAYNILSYLCQYGSIEEARARLADDRMDPNCVECTLLQ